MCDICLGERGGNTPECMTLKKQSVVRFPTDSKSSVQKKKPISDEHDDMILMQPTEG